MVPAELRQLEGRSQPIAPRHHPTRPQASEPHKPTVEAAATHPWLVANQASACSITSPVSPPDILICTPGRLVEHFERSLSHTHMHTVGMCTAGNRHVDGEVASGSQGGSFRREEVVRWDCVRWVVVDEADRLLADSFQSWVEVVRQICNLSASRGSYMSGAAGIPTTGTATQVRVAPQEMTHYRWDNDILSNTCRLPLHSAPHRFSHGREVQRLLFSATMTRNPQKLSALGIHKPLFFVGNTIGSAAVPRQLRQRYILCKNRHLKIPTLIYLIYQLSIIDNGNNIGTHTGIHDTGEEEVVGTEDNTDGSTTTDDESDKEMSSRAIDSVPNHTKSSDSTIPVASVSRKLKCVIFCPTKAEAHRITRVLQLHFSRDIQKQFVPSGIVPVNKCRGHCNVKATADSLELLPDDDVSLSQKPSGDELENEERDAVEGDTIDAVPGHGLRLRVAEFSASLSQGERNVLFEKFRSEDIDVLVSSDVLSRGIDVSDVDVVVNFNVPKFVNAYIHRSGRTARAGRDGSTYTLVTPEESDNFWEIIGKCGERDESCVASAVSEHCIPVDSPGWIGLMKYWRSELRRAVEVCLGREGLGRIQTRQAVKKNVCR